MNPKEKFSKLLEEKPNAYSKSWKGKKFEKVKFLASSEIGDLGEDFLRELLEGIGYSKVKILPGRRGEHDVSVEDSGKEILFEVKVASQDTQKGFQFNGIRYDTRYTHLFCLGILPEDIKYLIVEKSLIGRSEHKMCSMAKGSNSAFKLSKAEKHLKEFNNFESEIREIMNNRDW